MTRLQRFPIICSSMLGLSGRRGTWLDTVYFQVLNIRSPTIVCLKVVADLVGCDLPLVERNALSLFLRGFCEDDLFETWQSWILEFRCWFQWQLWTSCEPVFCNKIGCDLALDEMTWVAFCLYCAPNVSVLFGLMHYLWVMLKTYGWGLVRLLFLVVICGSLVDNMSLVCWRSWILVTFQQ